MTPRELSRYLPPKSATLDGIVLQVSQKEIVRRYTQELRALNMVAEPLGENAWFTTSDL